MNSIKNKNVKNFISFIESDLQKYGGKLIIRPSILNKNRCSDGEFSEEKMSIKCYYEPDSYYWVGVLAHEYAHFIQCKKGKKIWQDFIEETSSVEDIEYIFQNKINLKNKKINIKKRKSLISKILPLELEADKKALYFIKKFNIPLEKKSFIKECNIILYKYSYWAEFGIWSEFKMENSMNFRGTGLSKFKKIEEYMDIKKIPRKIFFLIDS